MVFRKQYIFFLLGVFFPVIAIVGNCGRSLPTDGENELIALILSNKPGVEGACEKFILTENLCVASPANPVAACDGTLQNRIRSGIQPENLRSDAILERYIRCFDQCNLEYNATTNCQSYRYSTNEDYRRGQRKVDGNPGPGVVVWFRCYNQCRAVSGERPKPESGLLESGTSFPEDWFR